MKRAKHVQLVFQPIIEQAFRNRRKAINRYISENRERYIAFADMLRPNLEDNRDLFSRLSFAILSANAPFDASVKALGYAVERYHAGELVERDVLSTYGMIPKKADWLNQLYSENLKDFRKDSLGGETWNEYRLRLKGIDGLGLAKASFAACLLYPLEADVACVDTWIQKVFLGRSGFQTLGLKSYMQVETQIRRVARTFHVSTFIAQWCIWDHARRRGANNHAIFPGSHKGELP